MPSDPSLTELLRTLYAAPMQPELWDAFLKQLSTVSGITKAALLIHNLADNDHRILASLGDGVHESENVHLYEEHYWQFDEWTLRFPKREIVGRIVQGEEIVPEASLFKSIFYNEFLKNVGVCEMACVVATAAASSFEALSIYRGPQEERFGPQELSMIQMLTPHLQSALAIRRRLMALDSRVTDLENALDQLETALVLVDAKGKPLLVNRAARRILDARDGLYFNTAGLAAGSSDDTSKLRSIVTKAVAGNRGDPLMHGGAILISRNNKRPLQVLVAPFISNTVEAPRAVAAVIFIADPESAYVPPFEILSALYGLTRAEVRVALLLLEGNSLSEAAQMNGVRLETVRSQLKSVLHKTDTRRQSELVKLLSKLPGQAA